MIRRLPARTDLDGLLADAREEGRDPVLVAAADSKQAALTAFKQAFGFPDWFGMNLDALADSLDDWAAAQRGEREIVWDGAATLHAADPQAADGIEAMLDDIAADHRQLTVTLIER